MRRTTFVALGCLAAVVAAPPPLSAEPDAPSTATSAASPPALAPPVETSSIGHPDAAIGIAARKLLGQPDQNPTPHLLPADAVTEATTVKGSDGTAAVAEPPKPTPEDEDKAALATFYQANGDAPLWVDSKGLTAKAHLAIAELQRAAIWGLDPADFSVDTTTVGAGTPTPESLATAESALSLAVMTYARHARGGRIPEPSKQLSSYLDRKPQYRDRAELLADLAKSDDPARVLIDLHPKHPQFELLRQAWLETLRAKSKAKSVKIPTGADLKPGETHADIALLRQRLDSPAEAGAAADTYDSRIAALVIGFQTLKGITPADGTLNAETRTRLNQPPVKGNADQLAANMQMWRYIPADLGDMHVMLNVPEYTIRIRKGGETIFTERVTVGLVNKQTPIFSDQIERVTFKSRWRVPDSIKVREIWPSLLGGGGLMRAHKLEMRKEGSEDLVDWKRIDWSKADMTDYVIWQPPGPWNQLGLVKFSFPNKHYVFMHDTPDKYMFNWTRRANSHGCMRIRNPLKMAEVILAADKGWDRAKIDDLVKNGPDHNIVELDRKVPVHITYFTARISDAGKIETFGDIYGHERRIVQALNGKWDKIAKGPDHLAPVDETKPPRVAARKKAPAATASSGDGSVQSLVNSVLGGF